MSLLIVKSAVGNGPEIQNAIQKLTARALEFEVIDTNALCILPCKGCCTCMLSTPGECCIQDDNERLLKAYLQYDHIVFIVDTALNYIDHKAKNIIDRIFPLVSVLTRFHRGEILHIPRYETILRTAILYTGHADRELLNDWMIRFEKNMTGVSLGAFPIEEAEEVCKCIL